jgi:hypothetical protein
VNVANLLYEEGIGEDDRRITNIIAGDIQAGVPAGTRVEKIRRK